MMKTHERPEAEKIRDFVRARYGAIAEQAGAAGGCGEGIPIRAVERAHLDLADCVRQGLIALGGAVTF